ncbi:hypothetical protein DWB85_06715 [Seongchinamella sediminis]|uniref:Uncharacterized protein n=1 Tax=Seongchinamella sediminis TaxID=2283635 RepID=A0A3L7E146_9GAMM|nr:hypothetical protein [Seongchinamella sediminis]RLQ22669.1 hypothetical protein DWB85_06715 [Seongchinamella sediminis]
MNRFNLTFRGEILPGKDPEQVKARFARLFGITDPERLEHFFTGETIILRRNLDRKVAGEYYQKLHKLGAEAELVKVTAETDLPKPAATPASKNDNAHADWETARQQAEREALARRTRGTAQRRELEREEAERKRQAEETERKRQAEEAARLKAEQEAAEKRAAKEAARRQAEEAARLKAEQEAERKRKAEAAARRKAAAAEARRQEAEAAAQKKAAEEEKRRQAAQAAAKKKAAEKEKRRVAAEKAAREKAAAEAERKRREAEAARIAAEAAEQERQEKAAEARRRAREQQEQKRQRELEKKRRAKAEARRKAEEKAARRKQREAEQAAQARAEQARRQAEQEALQRARELEERAIERGARALAATGAIRATRARVKSRLELPRRSTAYHAGKASQSRTAPNLYQLRPFRNTTEVRERPALAREKKRRALLTAATALALLLILLGRLLALTPAADVTGPTALAASTGGELAVLAGKELLLHDRAGVSTTAIPARELGLTALSPPLAYTPAGELLLTAQALEDPTAGSQLWQCSLDDRQCVAMARTQAPDALSVHPLSGELFVADVAGQSLAKLAADGTRLADTDRPLAANPVLRLNAGLLLVNSSEGPAVSVLRYEDRAFGQQLDEILLLPPSALEAELSRVWDFASSDSHWWAILYNPASGASGLYLFDHDWKFIKQLATRQTTSPGQLVNWGNKILLYHPQQAQILRFSAAGKAEAPLVSESLQTMIETRASAQRLTRLAWSLALILLLGIVLVSLARAYLQAARALVYRGRPSSGAAPLDDIADDISWIDAVATRPQQLRHANVALAVVALAVVILLVGLGVSLATLVGAILVLCGPLLALQLLLRSERDYLGSWEDHLVLVDHRRLYHLASGARIQYRGPFLLVDDVVVFTGTPLLPALDAQAINREIAPLAQAGVRVDRKTLLVKLLQSHHPLARGGQVAGLCMLAGLLVMILGQLPWQG